MDRTIFNKAAAYCSYQERSHQEVRDRLRKWNVWGVEADEIISELIVENYLSEERFAKTYAGGKHRIKKWGRRKIKMELQRKGVSATNIHEGMKEIDEVDYKEGLQRLLEKKYSQLQTNILDKRVLADKLMRYAWAKGYEADLVREVIEELFSSDRE